MGTRLLEQSPVEAQEAAKKSLVRAIKGDSNLQDVILAGMNPQHMIVTGGGAQAADSVGNPSSAGFIVSSGYLLSDFRFNLTAEKADNGPVG